MASAVAASPSCQSAASRLSDTPQRLLTPGDMAPLALAPAEPVAPAAGPSPWAAARLARSPSAPRTPSSHDAVHLGRVGSVPALPGQRPHVGPRGTGGGSCGGRGGGEGAWTPADQRHYEDRLRTLSLRQDGFEQRLQELGGALGGLTEEQSGREAQRHRALDDLRAWAQGRLREIEDMQKSMAVDLKVMSALVDESLRGGGVRPHGLERRQDALGAEALAEVRLEVKSLGQAMETLRGSAQVQDPDGVLGGRPASLAELGRSAELHGRRLLALTAVAGRWCTRQPPGVGVQGWLRLVLQEWRAAGRSEAIRPRAVRLGGDRSAEHAAALRELRRNLGTVSGKIDEQERGLSDLRDQTHLQDLHLARVDAALDVVLSNKIGLGAPSADCNGGGSADAAAEQGAARLADLLEALAGQAKAVEDLEVVVRDELRASRELAEGAAASAAADPAAGTFSQQVLDQVVQQGQAIERLRQLLAELTATLGRASPPASPRACHVGASAAAPTGLPPALAPCSGETCKELDGRVADLEEDMSFIREQLGLLVSVVQHVRDHAADALEDRVAAAMAEVRTRVAGCVGSLSERVDELRSACGNHLGSGGHAAAECAAPVEAVEQPVPAASSPRSGAG